MRKKIVAGNWKMNKNLQEGIQLAVALNEVLSKESNSCRVIIGTPFIHLAPVSERIDKKKLGLAAQNCADHVSGAYTGEVSAEMVKSTGAEYVILGHSERRTYYGETLEMLKTKVRLALDQQLQPIFCIGEVLSEREAGKQFEVVRSQIEASLFDLSEADFSKIILAYEPVCSHRNRQNSHRCTSPGNACLYSRSHCRQIRQEGSRRLLHFVWVAAARPPMPLNCLPTPTLTEV